VGRFDITTKVSPTRPPPRLVVYGEPKIGKTTFGAAAPGVVFVPTEDGALAVSVPKIPTDGRCQSWADVITALTTLAKEKHSFQTVVVDTLNGAEALCADMVCKRDFNGIWTPRKGADGYSSYGKGEKATAQEFKELLTALDVLQQKRNMAVILLSHAGLHKCSNALGSDFVKAGGDMSKACWNMVAGWADQIGYARRDARASLKDGEAKYKMSALSSCRYLEFDGGPGMDAGARAGYEMPAKITLSYSDYVEAMKAGTVGLLRRQLQELLALADAETKTACVKMLGGVDVIAASKEKLETTVGYLLSQQAGENPGKKE
jgi:hypothetical protein